MEVTPEKVKARKPRCQALDIQGKQCKRVATATDNYHGDGELYSSSDERPTWVKIWLCREHKEVMP